MALPKLNVPQYKVKIPTTGEVINMRPFLVREEKVLMIALESQDVEQISTAVREIILSCCSIDSIDRLASVDIEYLFLQLRAKSVGEKIALQTKCDAEGCDGLTKFELNLEDDIELINLDAERTIMLDKENGVGLTLQYPNVEALSKMEFNEGSTASETIMDIITGCIETIFDNDTVHNTKDVPVEEVRAFIESLSNQQFNKVQRFFQNAPSVYYETKTNCLKCEKEINVELKGLANFFG